MSNNDDYRGVVLLQSVNGCQIHFEIIPNSESSKTPLLLLHGWGCDASIYSGIVDVMQKYTTVITLDFPAHGSSDEPPEPWSVENFSTQVMLLLKSVNIVKVHIIAHSFGARVAIYIASHYPQMIDKLIITGGAGIKKTATAEFNKNTARYKRLNAMTRFFIKVPLLRYPMKKLQAKLITRYGSSDYTKLNEEMRATFVKIISEDLTPMLHQITAPTLLIWGSNDEETPLWMGKTMEREIPDAGLVVFENRSHYAFIEESNRFNLITKQFFIGDDEG